MLPLPQEYKVKGQRGFVYRQVKREVDVVLSTQHDNEDNVISPEPTAWEVFVVQKYPDRYSPDGKTFIPAKEAPPRSELWGSAGFTLTSLEQAEDKFAELVHAQRVKLGEPAPEVVVELEKKVYEMVEAGMEADRKVAKKTKIAKKTKK